MLSFKEVHTFDPVNSLPITDPEDVIFYLRSALCLQVLTVALPEMMKSGRNVNGLK